MNKKDLRKYLIGRFLLTLLAVGLLQMVINLAMRSTLMPFFERLLGLTGLLSGKSLNEAISIFWYCLLIIILRALFGAGDILERIFNNNFFALVFGKDYVGLVKNIDTQLDDVKLGFYSLKVVLLFLIVILLWVMPYVLGAVIYSKHVSKKVDEIERVSIEREREYERQRNLLISDVAHDIKTPITSVAGFARALADDDVPTEQRQEYLESIYSKSMHVSDLITLLFEYVKLDSKGYSLNKSVQDIAEIIRECTADAYAEMEKKHMEISIDIPEEKIYADVDAMQIKRVFNNLFINTVRHNPEGTPVFIDLKREADEVIFTISDRGKRIDSEDARHLFEPFYKADKSRNTRSGSGLGLSIAKKIVDMHGGQIRLIQYKDQEKTGKVKTFEVRVKEVRK